MCRQFHEGCGLGIVMSAIAQAVHFRGLDKDRVSLVSGIGCTGRVAGYMHVDSFHTTHGRAIPFATGLKLAAPEMKVVVYSGDEAAYDDIALDDGCVYHYTAFARDRDGRWSSPAWFAQP